MSILGCGFASCACSAGTSFRVWAGDGDPCSVIRSFNQLYAASELNDFPKESGLLLPLDGRRPGHPSRLIPFRRRATRTCC
jgi:hypothetical protein